MGKRLTYFSTTGATYPCNSEGSYRLKDGTREKIIPLRYLDPVTAKKLIRSKQAGASSVAIVNALPGHGYDKNGGSLVYADVRGEVHFSGSISRREPPFSGDLEETAGSVLGEVVSDEQILNWMDEVVPLENPEKPKLTNLAGSKTKKST